MLYRITNIALRSSVCETSHTQEYCPNAHTQGWMELISHYLHLDKQKWSALQGLLSWLKLRVPQQGLSLTSLGTWNKTDVHEELTSKNCEKFTLKEPACGDKLPLEIPWSQTGLALLLVVAVMGNNLTIRAPIWKMGNGIHVLLVRRCSKSCVLLQ